MRGSGKNELKIELTHICRILRTRGLVQNTQIHFGGYNMIIAAILILSEWLLILITFILSFSKHKYVSTVSYVVFVILCIYWGYVTSGGVSFFKFFSNFSHEVIIKSVIPLVSCILSFVSGVLWFTSKRKIARGLGLISIIAVMLIYINN